MDEKTKTIIDRARALLAAAGSKWDDVGVAGTPSGYWAVANARATYETANADAALIAAAPDLLTSICDALESAERRAEEAEAQAAATMAVIREIRETCCAALGDGLETIVTTGVVRILRDRLHAAEAKVARLEARKAAACGHCGGSGVTYDPDEVDIPEGPLPPEMVCPDCHGSGAVIVEGGE